MALEHGSGKRRLTTIVRPVHIGPAFGERIDEVRVAVVGRQHEQRVSRRGRQIRRYSLIDSIDHERGVAFARCVEEALGEGDRIIGEVVTVIVGVILHMATVSRTGWSHRVILGARPDADGRGCSMLLAAGTLILGIVVVLIIIAIGGFFVAQEFAYMSVDRARLAARAKQGDAASRHALVITKRTSFMLSGAQLGITVTGLLVGYVAEPMIGNALGTLLSGTGISMATSITAGTVLALVLATLVQMLFGELYPKNLAIAAPEPLARALARPTRIYLTLFGWLITIFDRLANALLRLLRIEPLEDIDSSASARDLEHIVEDSRTSGDLSDELSVTITRILDFPQRDVEHAMMPRARVDVVHEDTPVNELVALMASAHTRYPVVDANDSPLGVVELVDVLSSQHTAESAGSMMREPVIIPTTMRLPEAHLRMSERSAELACVVDEYGSFVGILTAEDLTEEIVGELTDEHDPEDLAWARPVGEGEWQLSGDVHLDEVERLIQFPLPQGDYETISGLVISMHGDLPDVGTRLRVPLPERPAELGDGFEGGRWLDIEVLELEHRVPGRVMVAVQGTEASDI